MNSIIFGLLAAISLFIFFNLGKVKASSKQTNRDDRINWGASPWIKKNSSSKKMLHLDELLKAKQKKLIKIKIHNLEYLKNENWN